jgi:hypothetical protein
MPAVEVIQLVKLYWRRQRSAIRRWGATAVLIVLLTPLRSLNLCVVAILGVAAFLASSPIGVWIRDIRRA